LTQKIGLLRSVIIFQGFLGEFLGYLEWLGPNHKYFSETEGPAVIFPSAQGPQQNLQEAYGPKCKIVKNYGFLIIIFNGKSDGPGPRRVHRATRLKSSMD
jgi:hypothetical protein